MSDTSIKITAINSRFLNSIFYLSFLTQQGRQNGGPVVNLFMSSGLALSSAESLSSNRNPPEVFNFSNHPADHREVSHN